MLHNLESIEDRFSNLESEINSSTPTVERCRDWAGMLAGISSELAYQVKLLVLSLERRDDQEAEQREQG